MATSRHWSSEILKDSRVKTPLVILLWAIVAFVIFLITKGFLGYHVKFLGFEVNVPKPDTAIKYQTVYTDTGRLINSQPVQFVPVTNIPQKEKAEKPKTTGNTQVIDSGGSGIQNNAPNYGIQAGRDVSISNERQLDDEGRNVFMNLVNKIRKDSSITGNCFELYTVEGTNGGKVASQLAEYLISKGYQQTASGKIFSTPPFQGVIVGSKAGCITIKVGIL